MTWVAVAIGGSAVVGAGVSLYGAKQSANAQDRATEANQEAQHEANKIGWTNYLLTRGIKPKGAVEPGEMPSSYEVVNARLPLWATVKDSRPVFRRKGATAAVSTPASGSTGTVQASAPVNSQPPVGGAPGDPGSNASLEQYYRSQYR